MTEQESATGDCACKPRSRPGWRRLARMLVLLAALCPGSGVHAGNDRQLVALINDLRQSSTGCGGRPVEPVAPLAPDERLARVRVVSEAQLQAALRQAGYRAAKVQVIAVSGPRDAATALRAIKQRYCRELLSAQFAEIGVLRLANSWQVVLARPLSFASLGDWQAVGRAVLAQVNQARAAPRRCGERAFTAAPALTWDARLAKAALLHSRDMAEHDYFSHRGRDGSYADLRATRQGYRWRRIGENLAAGQNSVEQVVAGWLSSPEHCANIMNPRFTEMGAAYVLNPKSSGGSYWAQLFGTPR